LFVLPRDPAAETWTGARIGTAGATERTGIPARDRGRLMPFLDSLAGASLPFLVVGELGGSQETAARTVDDQLIEELRRSHPQLQASSGNGLVHALRGKKSPGELALVRRAVEITVEAQKEAIRAVRADRNEYEIEALIEYVFRRSGAERPSFATIVGSGPNSTTLHYSADDRQIQAGEVVVMDIGASYQGYAADVTRTVPVSGKFTPEQRAVYQLVRNAQAAAEKVAKPGATAQAWSDTARAVEARGL